MGIPDQHHVDGQLLANRLVVRICSGRGLAFNDLTFVGPAFDDPLFVGLAYADSKETSGPGGRLRVIFTKVLTQKRSVMPAT